MKPYYIFISLIVHLFFISAASATRMLPISLEQLSTQASLIIVGQVISNEVKTDDQSGHIATLTQFKVIELIKGDAADTHTIKQIGGLNKDNNLRMRVYGVPEFTVGNEYVVFLPEKSSLGYSSPLGLHQGSFSIIVKDGEKIVSNGRRQINQNDKQNRSRNNNITIPLAGNSQSPEQSYLSDFINTVRAYNVQ